MSTTRLVEFRCDIVGCEGKCLLTYHEHMEPPVGWIVVYDHSRVDHRAALYVCSGHGIELKPGARTAL